MTDSDPRGDDGRDHFLSLDRQWIGYEKGYWATFRVRAVEVSVSRPHGLQYALTLHDASDERILSYDNAHAVDIASGPARKSKRPRAYDHVNRKGRKPAPYRFTTAYKLLQDFFAEVDEILRKEGIP